MGNLNYEMIKQREPCSLFIHYLYQQTVTHFEFNIPFAFRFYQGKLTENVVLNNQFLLGLQDTVFESLWYFVGPKSPCGCGVTFKD
jgi:hypothetical protein